MCANRTDHMPCIYIRDMERIPFSLYTESGKVEGFLNVMDKTEPPKWFHVMEKCRNGNFYRGQLMLNTREGWWLPDSRLEKYAHELGKRVEAWYQ